jgi:hypothetical protein
MSVRPLLALLTIMLGLHAAQALTLSDLAAASRSGTGLSATYFNDAEMTTVAVTRVDPVINFGWGEGSPGEGINADYFTARWTGYLVPRFTETYTFTIPKDDGTRLTINGKLLIDSWEGCGGPTAAIDLQANKFYPITVDFIEYGGGASIGFFWQSKSQPQEVVPQACLFPAPIADAVLAVCDGTDARKSALALLADNLTPRVVGHQPGIIDPSVSPAGLIACTVGWHVSSDPKTVKNFEIYITDRDGKAFKRFCSSSAGERSPAFSADGRKVAFASDRDLNYEIYVANAQGGQAKRVTNTPKSEEDYPALSPDGEWLVYQSRRNGKWALYRSAVDGSAETLLTDQGENQYPCVSPDGKTILFCSNREGNYEIYTMPADGGDPKRLTTTPGDDLRPRYLAQGTLIGFVAIRDGASNIVLMKPDGTDLRPLTTTGKVASFAWNL